MFVGDTFLTIFDRLSVKSVLTGRTGTFLGIIGSIAFIIISFVLFIGPVIFYFKGDYTQGIFQILKQQNMQLYTGCDFKLSISFYSKDTNQIVNLTNIGQFMQTEIGYYSPTGNYFQLQPSPCDDSYFAQMEDKNYQFKNSDCFIVPNGLQFASQYQNFYISVFGFVFTPLCKDPFLCVYSPSSQDLATNQRVDFFKKHYYVLRFTSIYVDQVGQFKKKFYEVYSTQWQGHDTVVPIIYVLFETVKIYLDNSIMPWFNNQTRVYPTWQGSVDGRKMTQQQLQLTGAAAFITLQTKQKLYFREYKKLDWLLGMLGGGIFLLFLIFWVVFNFINTIKQKVQTCQSTILVRVGNEINNAHKPYFSPLWYIFSVIPFNLKCFKRENKIMQQSQKMLDIAQLIKKLKVALKNLKLKKYPLQFTPSILQASFQQPRTQFTQQQLKYQINQEQINKLKNSKQTPQIYSDNLLMLSLYADGKENSQVQNKIKNILQGQIYSKKPNNSFEKKERQGICRRLCNSIGLFLANFIKFFDVFGAKPNLVGNPQNYSAVGCILTFLIIIISILTFALTLGNMGITRTYWDQIYVPPQKQMIKSVTGKQFRAAICTSSPLVYVSGQDRIVDLKFYQYKRNKNKTTQFYYNLVKLSSDSSSYFDAPSIIYNDISLDYCFRPQNGIPIQVYGDQDSENQAYIGMKIIPRCSGTPATCETKKNQTIQNFYNLLNIYPLYFALPEAKYYPQNKKALITPSFIFLSQYARYLDLNYTQPIEQQIYLESLQLVDNYASWIMGEFPKPKQEILSKNIITTRSHLKSTPINNNTEPYYRLKLSVNGNVQRVILSSYKIDFLFSTIGGCFIFFFFFFGCFGKAYNHYKIKVKLAQLLYNQEPQTFTGVKSFFNWARIFCCKDDALNKVQEDIQCTNLAKNVDNVYRLSAASFTNPYQRPLALIYLKQRIKIDEQVFIKPQQSSSQEDQDQFELDWMISKKLEKKKLNSHAIENIDQAQSYHQTKLQKEQVQARRNMYKQTYNQSRPNLRQTQKCKNIINNFDIFHNNSQLTLDGKRSVKSVFGGLFCICLFIFLCVLTSHFLTVYFSQFYQVSQTRIVDQRSEKSKTQFVVGKNFKLAVSFYKADSYKFYDVSSLVKDVGVSIIKYKVEFLQGYKVQVELEKIDLQPCPQKYFQGFIDPHDFKDYYENFNKAYCVPDGSILDLYGSADDPVRQYFSVKIYNKYAYNDTLGVQKVTQLLKNYLPRYHISNPTVDFRADGSIRYSVDEIIKSYYYQITTSRQYNLTVTKNIIQYDTAVNPTNQRPTLTSYELKTYPQFQFSNSFLESVDRFNQLSFYPDQMYKVFLIKTTKVNEIFSIVGGCIGLLFLGLGCIPRSYNQYKMRYMIGKKLYIMLGKKHVQNIKNKKGKPLTTSSKTSSSDISQLQYFSQFALMRAWILSLWGFMKSNYNTNDTMRVASLIQQRVGKDINIFQFMKNLRMCQNGIRNMNLINDQNQLKLSRIYPKHVIYIHDQLQQKDAQKELKNEVIQHMPTLKEAVEVNKLSYWQIKKIIEAKQHGVSVQNIFVQRWLDRFFNIQRPSTIASRSVGNISQLRSTGYGRNENQSRTMKEHQSNANLLQNQSLKQDQGHSQIVQGILQG